MPSGKSWSFRFVPEKLIEPARRLALAWDQGTHLFRGEYRVLPQTNIFNLDLSEREMAEMLFYLAIATVYGSKSDLVYEEVTRRVRSNRGFLQYFQTRWLAQVAGPELLAPTLREVGVQRHNEMAGRFVQSARYMQSICPDDPLLPFRTSGIDEFLRLHTSGHKGKISGLAGKTASLLAVYYRQIELLPEEFVDYFPFDIWVARVNRQMGALEGEGYVDMTAMEPEMRRNLYRFCQRHGISVLSLNNAMWRLGSSGCARCYRLPQEALKSFDRMSFCPVSDLCLGIGRDRDHHNNTPRGIDFNQPMRPLPPYHRILPWEDILP